MAAKIDRSFDRKHNQHHWKLMYTFEQKCTTTSLEKDNEPDQKQAENTPSLSSTLPALSRIASHLKPEQATIEQTRGKC